ncbi:Na+/H+ antiporter [Paenibacillus sp. Marseille-Q4541]|uniref:Na+/H+ antiporter n=1 Tax=Paenibacillus sp. Marseille-Q4541 TaxID=2831522 RepID=UPI001BAB1719|nr:Na+/H+ antiporter [Paenibacillus sp. Marseille-Q4541]
MELFITILILLIIIGLSNVINRFVPFIPVPLIQIALGVVFEILPFGVHLELNPELFFVLFIAPLLYNDGRKTPRDELWSLRTPILLLALGLVFLTVLVAGYGIHMLIPSIPLPAAFALAAILSPTDAVAVGAMAERVHLPKSILRTLEGEALMNDASGLVAFKFALAATVTGVFSLTEASVSFVVIAVGGLLLGAIMSFLIRKLGVLLRRLGMEDVTVHMLIQIITPFIIYLVSEELGLSGILAVVAGGIIHAIDRDRADTIQPKMQIVAESTWSVIVYILNGLVFVILGLQLPNVISKIWENNAFIHVQIISYIFVITLMLFVLRFVWIYAFETTAWKMNKQEKPIFKHIILTTLSGVRGAVTLAGAFSIPFVLMDGSPFPERDLILFISAGVILLTLITASIALPIIADKEEEAGTDVIEVRALAKMFHRSILAVKSEMNDENKAAVLSVVADLNKYLTRYSASDDKKKWGSTYQKQELAIRMKAIHAERKEIEHLLKAGEVNEELAMFYLKVLDRREIVMSSRMKSQIWSSLRSIGRTIGRIFMKKRVDSNHPMRERADASRALRMQTCDKAITAVRNQMNEDNRAASLTIISNYERIMSMLRGGAMELDDDAFNEKKLELQIKAIQEQRNTVQEMFETGDIHRNTAASLRQYINNLESNLLSEE